MSLSKTAELQIEADTMDQVKVQNPKINGLYTPENTDGTQTATPPPLLAEEVPAPAVEAEQKTSNSILATTSISVVALIAISL